MGKRTSTMENLVTQKMENFYREKKVLVTGHTGFKGSWLCEVLTMLGARVVGYGLEPPTNPNLYEQLNLDEKIYSNIGYIQDMSHLQKVLFEYKPEIVFHMAAQPLVRESYSNPVFTYETNVMGTVNLLECVRKCLTIRSVVNVTTDKVYENMEHKNGYKEIDRLNGHDPYSNSKSCSELVTHAYKKSFFQELSNIGVSTVRSGNVIGGGDFALDRIIPDCVRGIQKKKPIVLRNPSSVRPYQHVLEPIFAYLQLAMFQYEKPMQYSDCYNVGPDDDSCLNTEKLVNDFCVDWYVLNGEKPEWYVEEKEKNFHEAHFLKLNCKKIKEKLLWQPVWQINQAILETALWYSAYLNQEDVSEVTKAQIKRYIGVK